ncbi:D-alanyl-D-alanine dipeptidase [Leptolyngbya sp. 'hensonii']|uniref:M15 family metallopeptidase n=1 Tax=Leptolyngbya sp. 'hensonii' TaxID=1922337 RepID=UPI00094FFED0|nr:M15 family metallopeptidase [Leptolyngbya sp. 'hensonii']OLP17134.1 D-alanyl-D-alanine dipeptidase [Leptolyngbya sp. 'hensonii']
MKPYQKVPISECQEPLLPIPLHRFAVETPHPYEKLGAPYGGKSPYFLRQGVLASLIAAQQLLQEQYPGWQIQIFDAYRPIAVQQFMVEQALAELAHTRGLVAATLSQPDRQVLLQEVYQFWALPSQDPATPPPHSTGAALDITLVDATGAIVTMGSPIDEISPRSLPNHFAESSDLAGQTYHQHRQILRSVMESIGFRQHPNEWWHFSLGDQMWAWLSQQPVARYGSC